MSKPLGCLPPKECMANVQPLYNSQASPICFHDQFEQLLTLIDVDRFQGVLALYSHSMSLCLHVMFMGPCIVQRDNGLIPETTIDTPASQS